ncbi:MAG: glycosyltransferase family 4 protein [Candidatus Cloacimonetes bacterium]|nr:glycosyltransferase family 4 protein [Candidatus Cloacimonadota bacterium]MCF7868672.1 glycosyltransferase family 4 protein [Candidatus Cloacimonadota bacterium]
MKIGMILDEAFPPDPRVENEAVSLVNAGHEVFLFCLDYSHSQLQDEMIAGFRVIRKRLPRYLYRFSALAYTIPFYHYYLKNSIDKFLRSNHIQTIHIHDIRISRAVFWVNKKLNLPIILDLHENRPEIMKFYKHVNSFWGKLLIHPSKWKKYEKKYIKAADRVIVVTNEAKEYYLSSINSIYSNKIIVVPNTIRTSFYKKYSIDKTIMKKYKSFYSILYIGDTGLRRGLLTVFKALKYLIPKIPNIKIVVVGKSKEDNILRNFIRIHRYGDYIELAGWQDSKLLPSYILSSFIGICPLHRNIHHDTTYANKIFQYLVFGKPIVVSDCIAQKTFVQKHNCGLVFKDRDEKNFADKVIAVYENKNLYQDMSQNGKDIVRNSFNWGKTAKPLIELYEQIL